MNQLQSTWYVSCDESSNDNEPKRPYMVIGGIWCPALKYDELLVELETHQLCCDQIEGEMKFKKIRSHNLHAYKEFVDIFFEYPEIFFRCIVVARHMVDYKQYHHNDPEVAFYKFYRLMLLSKIECGSSYFINVDHRTNRQSSRLKDLQTIINNSVVGCAPLPVKRVAAHNSKEDVLIQLTDVLIGCVQCDWNKQAKASAKLELVRYVCKRLRFSSLTIASNYSKFEIFPWKSQAELQKLKDL